LVGDLRPKLHRYCARMTGSVIDGEDVVQEALAKAIEAFPDAGGIAHVEGWLFRIAHNSALDFLRRRIDQAQTYSLAERLALLPAKLWTFSMIGKVSGLGRSNWLQPGIGRRGYCVPDAVSARPGPGPAGARAAAPRTMDCLGGAYPCRRKRLHD